MKKIVLMVGMMMSMFASLASPSREAFLVKVKHDVEVKKAKISESLAKLDILTNDVAKFRSEYNSIDVPKIETITNWMSKTYFITKDYEIPIAKRRTMRMKTALKSKILNELYCKYFGCTMRGLLKDYEDELAIAKESYLETQRQLAQNNAQYISKTKKLEEERKSEYKKQIKAIDAEITKLKSSRKTHCETRKRNSRTGSLNKPKECAEMHGDYVCYSCREFNRKIERLMNERKSAEQVYESAKWSNRRSDLVDEKSTMSDKNLAYADYRNSQHTMYLVFREKILQKFIDKLQQKIDEEQNNVSELSKDIEASLEIVQNPELVSERLVAKIQMQKFDSAINRMYGIGSDGMTSSEREEVMKRKQKEEDERKRILAEDRLEKKRIAEEELSDRRLASEREHELQKLRIRTQADTEQAKILGDAMKNMKFNVKSE